MRVLSIAGGVGRLLLAALLVGVTACYNPALPEEPFWCGPGGACPSGRKCYGGVCRTTLPACMDPTNPEFAGWPSDADLEPNNYPELAVILPCGESPYSQDYFQRCPTRDNYTNGFMALLICPPRENDVYAIYLLSGETVVFSILYEYVDSLPRDLDATVFYFAAGRPNNDDPGQICNAPVPGCLDQVGVATSTNHNEEIILSEVAQEGWYYLQIFGKTPSDVNQYTVTYTLNPPQP